MSEFGDRLRQLRLDHGLSLGGCGRLVSYSGAAIWDFENDRRRVAPTLAADLDAALDAGGALVALAEPEPATTIALARETWANDDAETQAAALLQGAVTADNARDIAHRWMVTEPPQRFHLAAGRRIGHDLVGALRERVHRIRLVDDHAGGRVTHAVATAELAATAGLLRDASYPEDVGRDLLAVVAELCQIAGWVAADAGRPDEARRLYLAGVRAGHAAADPAGAASNLSSLAYLEANVGDPAAAVLIARSAHAGAPAAPAGVRALLLERVAWAHARAAEPGPAERALGAVEDTLTCRDPDLDPPWVYWLTAEEVQVMAGRVWTELRRPLRAVPPLREAIAAYPQDMTREVALYLTWLGEALAMGGEVEEAATVGLRALDLSRRAGSARSDLRVDALRRALKRHRGAPAVDEFLHAA